MEDHVLLPPLDLNETTTADPHRWARALAVPKESVDLYRDSDVIDLHLDSYIWTRILRYRLDRRHGRSPTGRHFAHQVDLPRALDGGLTGGIWSITTNPLRRALGRQRAFATNLVGLQDALTAHPRVSVVRSVAEYREVRARGQHGAFLGIQGGNSLSSSLDALDLAVDGGVARVTLVHLTNSRIGSTSSPLSRFGRSAGLSAFGRAVVERLEAGRVLVDLAHISEEGFWAAVEAHDRSMPLIVTHTGVDGVYPHWRNLTDEQVKAVADTGGCVGIMLHQTFLGRPCTAALVVDHLEHVVKVGGEQAAALGSDYDGMVSPPRDVSRHAHWPRLVAEMQRRGWSDERIRGVLGGNALRTIEAARG